MELSLAGLAGAVIGAGLGVLSALAVVSVVTQRLRALDRSETAADKTVLERKITLLRWIVLGVEGALFAALGYWFATLLGG
jgi:hypothetical protein